MSAPALRHATDAAQTLWAARVGRVVETYALELALRDDPVVAAALLAALLNREAPNAADLGAASVAQIVAAAGARAAAEAPRPDVGAPVELARTVLRAWRAAAAHPAPEQARRAVVRRIIDASLTEAWSDGMLAAMDADPKVVGWRRVSRPGCCGACLALANGSVLPLDERMARHPHCKCVPEPVVVGVNQRDAGRPSPAERWAAMSKAEQDATFAGHGGEAKADRIRDGVARVDDLVTFAPRRPGQTPVIYETPAKALAAA